jgi:hypothetical protein
MNDFKKFLDAEYTSDPAGLSRFATTTCKLVRVTRRWWRGYRTMDRAEITVAGEHVKADNATQPRWKLIPDEVKEEFANFDRSVDLIVKSNCVFAQEDENGRLPLLTGGGYYAAPGRLGRAEHAAHPRPVGRVDGVVPAAGQQRQKYPSPFP